VNVERMSFLLFAVRKLAPVTPASVALILDPRSKMPLLEDASDNPAVDNTDIQAVAAPGPNNIVQDNREQFEPNIHYERRLARKALIVNRLPLRRVRCWAFGAVPEQGE
jgi:hypothetical protein